MDDKRKDNPNKMKKDDDIELVLDS